MKAVANIGNTFDKIQLHYFRTTKIQSKKLFYYHTYFTYNQFHRTAYMSYDYFVKYVFHPSPSTHAAATGLFSIRQGLGGSYM